MAFGSLGFAWGLLGVQPVAPPTPASPDVLQHASLTGTPGGVLTYEPATFSTSQGPVTVASILLLDGVPSGIVSGSEIDSASFPGRTISVACSGSNSYGVTYDVTTAIVVPASGGFLLEYVPGSLSSYPDATPVEDVPGLSEFGNTPVATFNVYDGSIVMHSGQDEYVAADDNASVWAIVHDAIGTGSLTLTIDVAQFDYGKGGMGILIGGKDDANYIALYLNAVDQMEFGALQNGSGLSGVTGNLHVPGDLSPAIPSFTLQDGDKLTVALSVDATTIDVSLNGAAWFTANLSYFGNFDPSALGKQYGIFWRSGNFNALSILVPTFKIIEDAPVPISLGRLVEPVSGYSLEGRTLDITGIQSEGTGLEYAVFSTAGIVLIDWHLSSIIPNDFGIISGSVLVALDETYNGETVTVAVRIASDNTKFAAKQITLAIRAGIPVAKTGNQDTVNTSTFLWRNALLNADIRMYSTSALIGREVRATTPVTPLSLAFTARLILK